MHSIAITPFLRVVPLLTWLSLAKPQNALEWGGGHLWRTTAWGVLHTPPPFFVGQNHLEERLLDQALARASYTPLFWGHSRSIPEGMILDVQPLVKSLFCPIRQSPNGFFDSEASIP